MLDAGTRPRDMRSDSRKRFADLGSEHVGSSLDEFAALVTRELKVWADVVRRAGMKVE